MKLKSTKALARRNSKKGRLARFSKEGAATVELAVCLPIIVIISLGAMESSSMIFLRQALVQSAYESCKEAVKTDGSLATARLRGEQVLSFRGIENETISFNPANVEIQPRGTQIVVTVTAPADSNSVLPFGPFTGKDVSVTATMVKE